MSIGETDKTSLSHVYRTEDGEVLGLWFDARGTASNFLQAFVKNQGLLRRDLQKKKKNPVFIRTHTAHNDLSPIFISTY